MSLNERLIIGIDEEELFDKITTSFRAIFQPAELWLKETTPIRKSWEPILPPDAMLSLILIALYWKLCRTAVYGLRVSFHFGDSLATNMRLRSDTPKDPERNGLNHFPKLEH